MDLGITGRRALILGSSQGLGLAIARTLAAEGVQVTLSGRSAERLESARSEIGGDAKALVLDQSDADAVDEACTMLADEEVDILVTNCGGPPPGPISDVGSDVWRREFEAMVNSPMRIAASVLPGMRARGFGRIVNIVSSGVVQPIPNLGVSNTLRISIIGWAKTLANEVAADGVTVNSVIPGRIHTSRVDQLDAAAAKRTGKSPEAVAEASRATIPMGRYGDPQEFANAAVFLASACASYITGTSVRIDGGMIRGV